MIGIKCMANVKKKKKYGQLMEQEVSVYLVHNGFPFKGGLMTITASISQGHKSKS